MSGRLVILPKKSYCPWNPQNVERVLRDERLERERQQQEAEAARQQQRRPWQQLVPKETTTCSTTTTTTSDNHNDHDSNQPAALQHFNLFAAEEMAMLEGSVRGSNATPAAPKGIMAVPLGGDAAITSSHQQHQLPFYLRPAASSSITCTDLVNVSTNYGHTEPSSNPTMAIHQRKIKKEERLKAQMDPMHAFHSHHDDNFESSKRSSSAASRALVVIEEPAPPTMIPNETKDSIVMATTDDARRRQRRRRHRKNRDDSSSSSHGTDSERKEDASRERRRKRKKRRHSDDDDEEENDQRRRHRHEDEDRRRHHRRKHHHRRKRIEEDDDVQPQQRDTPKTFAANDNAQPSSLEELRQRRAQREANEARRQLEVIQESSYVSSLPRRGYHNQFNPSLSRK